MIATFLEDPEDGEVTSLTTYIRNNGQLEAQPSFSDLLDPLRHLGRPVQPNGRSRRTSRRPYGNTCC